MEILNEFINSYTNEIIIGLSVFSLFLFTLNTIGHFKVKSITKKYNRLVDGVKEDTLENMLIEHLDEVKNVKNQLKVVEKHCIKLDDKFKKAVQKVGIIRYNAFSDMGSDLCFSLALLDENLDGLVITSLYGRNESNTYGKPIKNGKSKYDLSVEEMQAIDKAIKG